jgi:cation:H+ antiporter
VLTDIAWVVLGALVLYLGAEWLVKGSSGLALATGLRPLVVGLTVVAYGTSAPELAVGVAAALKRSGDLALGNSIGSNVANLGLILGMTALISPPRIDAGLLRIEIPALVMTAALVPLVLLDGVISRLEGGLMTVASIAFTLFMIRRAPPADATEGARSMERAAEAVGAPAGGGKARLAAITVVGLALLVGGGKLLVDGAVGLARSAGMSERLVGLTVVAIGTSLPELAASLVAAGRGQPSIAVGNVVGSNVFNVLAILGVAALVRPLEVQLGSLAVDLGWLAGLTLAASLFLRTARVLRRSEGVVLILAYVGFLVTLVLRR